MIESTLHDQTHQTKKLMIAILLLLSMFSHASAQDDLSMPVVYAETDAGITLYAVSADKTLGIVGHLPDDFGACCSDSDKWIIRNNLVVSPDEQKLAFIAELGSDSDTHVSLYIFSLTTQSIHQVFDEDYAGYFFQLKWSPDSQFLLIEPGVEDNCGCGDWPEIRVYDLVSGGIYKLTDRSRDINGGGFTWMQDSRRLTYSSDGISIVAMDGGQRQSLVNFELNPPPDTYPTACNPVWSEQRGRLYYVAGCLRLVDDPLNVIYSVDLSGQQHVEAFLPDLLRNEFTVPATYNPYVEDIQVDIIHPTSNAIYAALGFKALVTINQDDETSEVTNQAFWRVIRLRAPGQIETVFEFTAPKLMSSGLEHVAFAPDNQKAALVDSEHVVVGDLLTGEQLVNLTRTLEYWYQRLDVLWINADELLYAAEEDVWLLDITDRTTTNLTAEIEARAFLLPHTNSY